MKSKTPETWKTVPMPGGGELSFFGDEHNNKIAQMLNESLEQKHAEREAIATEVASRPPLDLTPNDCVVAFIDILGFGHEIERAVTRQDLQRLHAKVRLVQAAFQKESAAKNPREQEGFNRLYGRRVIALSDAVIVAFEPTSDASKLMGEYDRMGLVVHELLASQGSCVIEHGIFIRGGVSHGSFFFGDDVLLSPALARAYKLESDYADHPIIVVPESTRHKITEAPQDGYYAPGWDPRRTQLVRHGRKTFRGESLCMLNYLPAFLSDADDPSAALRVHKQRIESAYTAATDAKVKSKYRWLMGYHNKVASAKGESLNDYGFDLNQFTR